jgi:hypothetical protein
VPNSEALHLVERFTPSADGIDYELLVEDSENYTRPWRVSLPLRRDPGYTMFEYACHEGNLAIELSLRGRRFEERQGRDSPQR